jgi:hypothetical protein
MTKTLPIIVVTTLLSLVLVGSALGQSATPEAQAKSFYAWYMHELNAERDPIGNSKGLRPYVTARMIRSIERALKTEDGIDADIFIDAQDFDAKWEKNITTSRAVIRGASATLTVSLKGGPDWGTRRLRLVMKKEGGAWKIDSVNGHANP